MKRKEKYKKRKLRRRRKSDLENSSKKNKLKKKQRSKPKNKNKKNSLLLDHSYHQIFSNYLMRSISNLIMNQTSILESSTLDFASGAI